jgi:hypothetical protein
MVRKCHWTWAVAMVRQTHWLSFASPDKAGPLVLVPRPHLLGGKVAVYGFQSVSSERIFELDETNGGADLHLRNHAPCSSTCHNPYSLAQRMSTSRSGPASCVCVACLIMRKICRRRERDVSRHHLELTDLAGVDNLRNQSYATWRR